ncbi:MAG: (deoxy)nucleoside triphosphate pyrophosphohydrolase [Acidobacteriota bacterium]|jgi:8-oxo-dGTP diphosphatase
MAGTPREVVVAAGILRRGDRILACRRRLEGAFPGKWELPGGKLQDGESPGQALVRELREELAVEARPGREVARVRHEYADHAPVRLHFFEVESFQGEPRNLAFEEIRWASPRELLELDWLEADRPLVRRLAGPHGMT